MGSNSWEGGGGAEPDLSWMSFSPEAHGLKPALSVWPSRSNDDNNYNNSIPDNQQQQEEEEEQEHAQQHAQQQKKKRFGFGFGIGRGRSKSQTGLDHSENEWVEEEIVEEEEEEERQRRGRSRRRGGDRRNEQARKVREDFEHDDDGDDDAGGGWSSRIRRPPSPPSLGRGIQMRGRHQTRWVEGLDEEDRVAAAQQQLLWSTTLPRRLQFAAVVASCGCVMALAISIVLLYLSFGVTARPPTSCEVEKVVLNFTAQRIRLRGGRYISFREQGVGAVTAQHSLLVVHDLLSSRLAGIPGISESLLQEFGVRLIAYDRPGYGQSDPHLGRSYNSSAQDMADIADALGVGDKFWVAGFGSGGPHVWAAINYIPDRLAGVALFAPAGNFYAENMTKDEVSETWGLLTLRQKWMYSMARLFPAILPSLVQKTLIDHNPSPFRCMSGPNVGSKDQALMEKEEIVDFWKHDMREALEQKCAFPVAEELILLVKNWGFSLAKLPFNEIEVKTLLQQVVGLFQPKDNPRIFSGPIHVWQGTDDQHVPATFNAYAKRMIEINDFSKRPDYQVNLHILEGEGHFSWFWFCDECHRSIFRSLFEPGAVSGPFGRQVFSPEEFQAILAAFGGSKERVDKLTKTEEAFGGSKERVDKLTKTEEDFGGSKERVDKLTKTKEASGGSKERLDMLTKTEEAPIPFAKNIGGPTDDVLYRDTDSEEAMSTGIKLFVPESCDVPIDISAFIIRAIDERIKKYFK